MSPDPARPECTGTCKCMVHLVLASALARWLPAGSADSELILDVNGDTLGSALEDVFLRHPGLRGYVLDELGRLRHHVAVFVDGDALPHRDALAHPLASGARAHLMQALSGG